LNEDFAQAGKRWSKLFPDPTGDVLAGWIFQTFDLIQVPVVNTILDRSKRRLYIREIHDPTMMLVKRSFNVYLNAKTVAMEATAFMTGRHMR
jgi:hypothetical protein